MYHSAVLGLGVKRGRCVVLVTHQHQYIGESRCVLMKEGRIECDGTYMDCVEKSGGSISLAIQSEDKRKVGNDDIDNNVVESGNCDKKSSMVTVTTADADVASRGEVDTQKEDKESGTLKWMTISNYARAMGGLWVGVGLLLLLGLGQAAALITVISMGKWADMPREEQARPLTVCIMAGLGLTTLVLALVRVLACFRFTIRASRVLHDRMTEAVVRSRIEFFDTNPSGR